jgi:uncharacterized protein YaiL (DUF2058 family)
MGDSLQDQLRALGLASQQKGASKGGKEAGKPARKRPAQQPAGRTDGEMSLDQAWALREQEEQRRGREEQRRAQEARSRRQEEERRRRAINEQVRAIIDAHRLNRDDAEIARNFLFRGRIRRIYVTPEQQAALTAGELGIAYLAGAYHVLAPDHLEAVRAVSCEHVVELDSGSAGEEAFPVPEDLQW